MQVKWHPDNFPGADPAAVEAREFAGMVARIANEAANKAKRVRNKEIFAKRRAEAFQNLEDNMPSFLGGFMGGGKKTGDDEIAALRAAIDFAKEASVTQVHIDEAEEALRKMEKRAAKKK